MTVSEVHRQGRRAEAVMKLDDFSSRIRSHGDLCDAGVTFGADEAEDRILLSRRATGDTIAISVLSVVESEWTVLERLLLVGPVAGGPVEPATPDLLTKSVAWSRSHFGLLKDRLVRHYSVETLISR